MGEGERDRLAELVEAILGSPKYRGVNRGVVERIGAQELVRQRKLKEAVKATKNKLHQVGGAYLEHRPDLRRWLEALQEAARAGGADALRGACRSIMAHHASTRERLPILDRFYAETLSDLPPIRSVLDVACGLNPLAAPWMPLAEGAEYLACDIYENVLEFLDKALAVMGVRGSARPCDLSQSCPADRVDVALVLKTIPCLEQLDKSAGSRLLDGINADHILVSFPVRSLCGRTKGMAANYESRFRALASGRVDDPALRV